MSAIRKDRSASFKIRYFIGALIVLMNLRSASAQLPSIWTASWTAAQYQPTGDDILPKGIFNGGTLRQAIHLTVGGSKVRLRFANTFANQALVLRSVHVAARQDKASTDANTSASTVKGTDRIVLFNGSPSISIPMGSEYVSDPINLSTDAFSNLVVSILIDSTPEVLSFHGSAFSTSSFAQGNHAADVSFVPAKNYPHWYFLSGADVSGTAGVTGTVVAFGDSITDGIYLKPDQHDRWPDFLAKRLAGQPGKPSLAVVNEGIGGNKVLDWGIGPWGLSRFDRDVLAQPGIRYLIVLEGVNDLGGLEWKEEHPQSDHDQLVSNLEQALAQFAVKSHDHGIPIFVGTVTPYGGSGYKPSARSETDRQRLNNWIRSSRAFDAVIDFDAALRDPSQPDHLLSRFDSGDHIHPNVEGFRRMGEMIPSDLFSH